MYNAKSNNLCFYVPNFVGFLQDCVRFDFFLILKNWLILIKWNFENFEDYFDEYFRVSVWNETILLVGRSRCRKVRKWGLQK